MDIKIFKDEEEFVAASVTRILHACEAPQGDRPRVALSGGSTPEPVYRALAEQSEFLEIAEFYQIDERYVPADDAKSNQKLIRDTLNSPHFVPFDTTGSIDDALNHYEKKLYELGEHPFDSAVLGVGNDGHIASLFPGSGALNETDRWVAHTTTDVHDIRDRLTLTLPPILLTKSLLILLKGSKKRVVLETLLAGSGDINEFPALALLKHPNLTLYYYEND
jgi:6-phosphogluconolactonase